jgi:hypothetical protein
MTHYTNNGEKKVSLDLVNARSKLNGHQYLIVLLDPGSIRVNLMFSANFKKAGNFR